MNRIWAGIDSGKPHHHCLALDADGKTLLSRRVANDEPEVLQLLKDVLALGEHVTWAVDMAGGEPALLLTLLTSHGQEPLYIPGRVVNRASDGYSGEGKTDARDALVIADQARVRRDLKPMRPTDEATIELKLLTSRRKDLTCDRTRSINRLRAALSGMFPALESALALTSAGPLTLLAGYQTPGAIRPSGTARLTRWLRARGVRSPDVLTAKAVAAADRQYTAVPGEAVIASRSPARLLHVRPHEHPLRRELAGLLRAKRREGKRHVQAVLALARRRVNVLWALIRDRRCYLVTPPAAGMP